MNMYLDWEWHFIEGGRVIARTKVLHFALVYLILSTTRIVMLAQAAVLFNGHEEEEHSGGKADHDQALPPRDLSSLLSVLRGGGAKGSSDNTSTQAVEILLDDISRTSRALAESGNVQQLRLLLQEIQQGFANQPGHTHPAADAIKRGGGQWQEEMEACSGSSSSSSSGSSGNSRNRALGMQRRLLGEGGTAQGQARNGRGQDGFERLQSLLGSLSGRNFLNSPDVLDDIFRNKDSPWPFGLSPEELFGSGDVPRNARIDNLLKTAGSGNSSDVLNVIANTFFLSSSITFTVSTGLIVFAITLAIISTGTSAVSGPYAWSLGVQQVLNDLQAEQPLHQARNRVVQRWTRSLHQTAKRLEGLQRGSSRSLIPNSIEQLSGIAKLVQEAQAPFQPSSGSFSFSSG